MARRATRVTLRTLVVGALAVALLVVTIGSSAAQTSTPTASDGRLTIIDARITGVREFDLLHVIPQGVAGHVFQFLCHQLYAAHIFGFGRQITDSVGN